MSNGSPSETDQLIAAAQQISQQISSLSGHVSGHYGEIQRLLVEIHRMLLKILQERFPFLESEFSNTRSNVAVFTQVVRGLDQRMWKLEQNMEKMLAIYEGAKRQLNRLNKEREQENQPTELLSSKQRQEKVIELLSDPDGATIPDLMAATGLTSGTCSSMISSLRNGRLTGTPIEVISVKPENEERRYFAR